MANCPLLHLILAWLKPWRMGKLKTDITDKVDRAGTELNCLVEMIIDMKAAIKINERMLAELHPQMVKEYQQLHKT